MYVYVRACFWCVYVLISISGETSAGKSTLINKILGMRIFKGRNNESTSTICKIRNSASTRIITESMTGQIKETDLTETNDTEKALRDYLKNLTDMTSSKESMQYRSVDIGFPIPFLKVNITHTQFGERVKHMYIYIAYA